MRYHRQTRNACLAYSLLQLGRVSKKAVKEYETMLQHNGHHTTFFHVVPWLKEHAPEVAEAWAATDGYFPTAHDLDVPKGKGIAVVLGETAFSRCYHAVSYEDGKLLDSDSNLGHTEALDEFKARWKAEGWDAKIITHFPIDR